MLFYESAACIHGRRQEFKGRYYGSLFLHYMPVEKGIWDLNIEDVIRSVPPHWMDGIIEESGSRWSGQGLTVDSLITDGAKERVILGERVGDVREYYKTNKPDHYRRVFGTDSEDEL
jgi:hypothetical protein